MLGLRRVAGCAIGIRTTRCLIPTTFSRGKDDHHRGLFPAAGGEIYFWRSDNRDGEAKLVLVEKYEGREMNERVLGIPVSRSLPRKHNDCERVSVTLSLDEDLILRAFGKGATQETGANAEYHDLLFALDTNGVRQ